MVGTLVTVRRTLRSAAKLPSGRASSATSHCSTAVSITGPPASVRCAWRYAPACVGLPLRRHGTQRRNRESQLARARGESLTASSKTTRAESTPPAHVAPGCSASWSRSVEGDVDEVRTRLAMLKTVSNDSKGQSLHLGLSLRRRSAVSQDAGQFGHFGQPPPVLFALDLDPEPHEPILPPACWSSVEHRDKTAKLQGLPGFVSFIPLLGSLVIP